MRSRIILAFLLWLCFTLPTSITQSSETPPLTLIWESDFNSDAALVSPSDVVVDSQGYVYVSTQAMHQIKKFDQNGKLVLQYGSSGTGDGQFNLTSGITVDSEDNLYVADFFNIRIQKFDSEGNFLLKWSTERPAGPASIAVDADGYAYVDNFFPHKNYIQKFDVAGNLVHQWGTSGSEPGQFGAGAQSGPEDMALDPQGNIYVVDRVNHRVQKFDSDGNLLGILGGEASKEGYGLFDSPLGLAIDRNGYIYVMDVVSNLLQKLDPEGNFVAQWSTKGGDLDEAAIVALDAEANIYTFAKSEVTAVNGSKARVYVLKKFQQPDLWSDES